MKMKNAGDIFTASSMGWGGGCKYCTYSPNFFGGVGEEKNVSSQTGMPRAEGFFNSLCKHRLDIKAIKLAVVHH